jgi:hypothetical protein
VLEYAGKFTGTGDAYHDFLEQVRSYLKPDGTLIIAIENKFGLKYWAGAKEDHTNNYFDGIENYLIDRGVRTFGKSELKELLNRAGFANAVFHYPMPDYKLPLQVFSDRYLPRIGQIGGNSPNYDNDRHLLFNEKVVYDNLVLNGQFDFFANSFLVFCTDSGAAPATVYSKFNRDRLPTFQIETSIFRDRDGLRTVKKPLAAAAGPHMARIVKNYELLKDAYRDLSPGIAAGAPAGAGVMIDYMDGKSLDTLIMDALLRRDLAGFHALLDSYVAFVRMLAPGAPASYLPDEGSDRIFGDFSRLTGMAHAAIANIDLRPDNIIVGRDGSYGIIDYEWVFAFPMPVNFVIYRSIRDFWNSYREYLDGAVRREEMFVRYGITAGEREVYDRMEISFQAYINGRNEEYKVKRGYRKAVIPFRGNSTYTLKDVIRKPKLLFRKRK